MAETSCISNFKKLPGAFLMALSVILSLYFIEIFILPINFFTFRVWEALDVRTFLPGDFYPNMKISMIEVGSLGQHTRFAVKRKVEWETDRYGYRKRDIGISRYPIVIIGDSSIVGPGLTQKDILSEVLERRLKMSVYPFTSTTTVQFKVNKFLHEKRFVDYPPDIVILASGEGGIAKLAPLELTDDKKEKYSSIKQRFNSFLYSHQYFAILLDRIDKNNMAFYFMSRIRQFFAYPLPVAVKQEALPLCTVQSMKNKQMLFNRVTVEKIADNKDILPEDIEGIMEAVNSYKQVFDKRGIRFIFLPIPDKENIYYDYLPIDNVKKPAFLAKLIPRLQSRGVEVIDTDKAFYEAYRQNNSLLYQTDDIHWNELGVQITADLIEKELQRARQNE